MKFVYRILTLRSFDGGLKLLNTETHSCPSLLWGCLLSCCVGTAEHQAANLLCQPGQTSFLTARCCFRRQLLCDSSNSSYTMIHNVGFLSDVQKFMVVFTKFCYMTLKCEETRICQVSSNRAAGGSRHVAQDVEFLHLCVRARRLNFPSQTIRKR